MKQSSLFFLLSLLFLLALIYSFPYEVFTAPDNKANVMQAWMVIVEGIVSFFFLVIALISKKLEKKSPEQ